MHILANRRANPTLAHPTQYANPVGFNCKKNTCHPTKLFLLRTANRSWHCAASPAFAFSWAEAEGYSKYSFWLNTPCGLIKSHVFLFTLRRFSRKPMQQHCGMRIPNSLHARPGLLAQNGAPLNFFQWLMVVVRNREMLLLRLIRVI